MKIRIVLTDVPDELVPDRLDGMDMAEIGVSSEVISPEEVLADSAAFNTCIAALGAALWVQWNELRTF